MIKPTQLTEAMSLQRELEKLTTRHRELHIERIDVFIGSKNISGDLKDGGLLDEIRDLALDRIAALHATTIAALAELGVDTADIERLPMTHDEPEPPLPVAIPDAAMVS